MDAKVSEIETAIDFIESLPEEITWVISGDSGDKTETIGREFALQKLKEAL